MIFWLLKRFFGGYGAEKRHDGAMIVVECGESLTIQNKITEEYIDKLNASGEAKVTVQYYPDFEAGLSGEVLRRYYDNEIDLSPMELLQANIANKIETFSKIQNLIDDGYIVVCERHWMYDVATAVSHGENEEDCVKAYPDVIKEMPDSVFFFDITHDADEDNNANNSVEDYSGEDDDNERRAAFEACIDGLYSVGASRAAMPLKGKFFDSKPKMYRATFEM